MYCSQGEQPAECSLLLPGLLLLSSITALEFSAALRTSILFAVELFHDKKNSIRSSFNFIVEMLHGDATLLLKRLQYWQQGTQLTDIHSSSIAPVQIQFI